MSTTSAGAYIVKKIAIRGIGDDELVCVRRDDFNLLTTEEKKIFKAP
jgi:hypothetical protein